MFTLSSTKGCDEGNTMAQLSIHHANRRRVRVISQVDGFAVGAAGTLPRPCGRSNNLATIFILIKGRRTPGMLCNNTVMTWRKKRVPSVQRVQRSFSLWSLKTALPVRAIHNVVEVSVFENHNKTMLLPVSLKH